MEQLYIRMHLNYIQIPQMDRLHGLIFLESQLVAFGRHNSGQIKIIINTAMATTGTHLNGFIHCGQTLLRMKQLENTLLDHLSQALIDILIKMEQEWKHTILLKVVSRSTRNQIKTQIHEVQWLILKNQYAREGIR